MIRILVNYSYFEGRVRKDDSMTMMVEEEDLIGSEQVVDERLRKLAAQEVNLPGFKVITWKDI